LSHGNRSTFRREGRQHPARTSNNIFQPHRVLFWRTPTGFKAEHQVVERTELVVLVSQARQTVCE
jgi:hypothetical protein